MKANIINLLRSSYYLEQFMKKTLLLVCLVIFAGNKGDGRDFLHTSSAGIGI